ncbi:MAG: cytochrome c [Parvularculaceae bacterium]
MPASRTLVIAVMGLGLAALPLSTLTAQDASDGAALFADWGCGGCHTLAAAGAAGRIGPAFDGDPNLSFDYIVARVTNGQGAMPAFGGQLSEEEIADLAAYILDAAE